MQQRDICLWVNIIYPFYFFKCFNGWIVKDFIHSGFSERFIMC